MSRISAGYPEDIRHPDCGFWRLIFCDSVLCTDTTQILILYTTLSKESGYEKNFIISLL